MDTCYSLTSTKVHQCSYVLATLSAADRTGIEDRLRGISGDYSSLGVWLET